MFTDKTEPPGSASSSPDDESRCGHTRKAHAKNCCNACPGDEERSWRHAFVLAEPEYRYCSESEHDWSDWGAVYLGGHLVWRRCATCQATESRTDGHYCPECTPDMPAGPEGPPEPEAPEEPPCPSCGQQAGTWFDRSVCAEPCGSAHDRCSNCGAATGDACLNEMEASPPQRFPFTLTYALASGERREVTLSGDVAVRVAEDGALIITHESPIRALTEIRPNKDTA